MWQEKAHWAGAQTGLIGNPAHPFTQPSDLRVEREHHFCRLDAKRFKHSIQVSWPLCGMIRGRTSSVVIQGQHSQRCRLSNSCPFVQREHFTTPVETTPPRVFEVQNFLLLYVSEASGAPPSMMVMMLMVKPHPLNLPILKKQKCLKGFTCISVFYFPTPQMCLFKFQDPQIIMPQQHFAT